MRFFPVFMDLQNQIVLVSGAGEMAAAKIRLLLKTDAHIRVVGQNPCPSVCAWSDEQKIEWRASPLTSKDFIGAKLVYCANDNAALDRQVAGLARKAGAIVNIVDNLEQSDFLTPAMVDRSPLVVAIGTEGAAPVLARQVKAKIEDLLPTETGILARIAQEFRQRAEALPTGFLRRQFWNLFFANIGPAAFAKGGSAAARDALSGSLKNRLAQTNPASIHMANAAGSVAILGIGAGDPDLLTRKAHRFLHEADIVIHDQSAPAPLLDLARREAEFVRTDGSCAADNVGRQLLDHALAGHRIAILVGGAPDFSAFHQRLFSLLDAADISWEIVPGVPANPAPNVRPDIASHIQMPPLTSLPNSISESQANGQF